MNKTNHTHIHVFMAFNDAYTQHACVTIASTLLNSTAEIRFHILNPDMSPASKEHIKSLRKLRPFEVGFVTVNLSEFSNLPKSAAHISMDCYSRLLIPWIDTSLDKALYLDADIAVPGDIRELWKQDVSDAFAGMIRDIGAGEFPFDGRYRHLFPKSDYYFNAGVMLLNLKKIREAFTKESLLGVALKNHGIFRCADQDAVNAAFSGGIRSLPVKWNVMELFFSNRVLARTVFSKEMIEARQNPTLVHFTGHNKPWKIPEGFRASPYAPLYFQYLRKTPFAKKETEIFREAARRKWKDGLRYWWRHPLFFTKPRFWAARRMRRSLSTFLS